MAFIGWPELVLILAIVVLIFGATRLTGLGKALGKAVSEFKVASTREGEKEEQERKKKAPPVEKEKSV